MKSTEGEYLQHKAGIVVKPSRLLVIQMAFTIRKSSSFSLKCLKFMSISAFKMCATL